MSKKNRNRPVGGRVTPPTRAVTQSDEVNIAIKESRADSERLNAANEAAAEAGVKAPQPDSRVDNPSVGSLNDACLKAYRTHLELADTYKEAKQALDRQRAQLVEDHLARLVELEESESKLAALQASLEPQVVEVARAQSLVESQSATIADRIKSLDEREEDLARRETDLAAGRLAAAFDMYVAPLEQRRNELFARFSGEIAAAQDQARKDLLRLRTEALQQNAAAAQELANERATLDAEREEVAHARAAIDAERARLDRLANDLIQRRESMLDDVRAEADDERQLLEIEREAFNEAGRRRDLEAERTRRKATLVEFWESELGDVEGVNAHLEAARAEVERLTLELAKRSSLFDEVELRACRVERDKFAERVEQLNLELCRREAYAADVESKLLKAEADRDAAESLIATVKAYQKTTEELRHDLENLSKTGESKTPFRECSRMDDDSELRRRQPLIDDDGIDLREFVDAVQWSLYHDPTRSLSYRKRDLRIFVAGLAMSRLHILEGVSGTGKTTLPIAFARHIGGGSANVAVQAGWRDRQDLLGYFNEFQGHFRESDFLRGMYRAMTPAYSDGAFFVVLDEMNLSKVEQYFADYLKALEDAEGADLASAGAVPLMDRSDIVKPARLQLGQSGGLVLPLPPNLWFIGTANQDETTQSFAPKTQSRAHIMQLPHSKPTEEEMNQELASTKRRGFDGDTVPYSLLRLAFETAKNDARLQANTTAATGVFEAVNDAIAALDPSLSLAPRFYRQLGLFVPVFLAAGGELTTAIDHLVCSKVIRRMNERYNIQRPQREEFDKSLRAIWSDFGLESYQGSDAVRMLRG